MLKLLIFLLFCVDIFAIPVTETLNDPKFDQLSENSQYDGLVTSADSVNPGCASNAQENVDSFVGGGQGGKIHRRQPGASCSVLQPSTISVQDPNDTKYRILPEPFQPGQTDEMIDEELDRKCPIDNYPHLLYCAGPELSQGGHREHLPSVQPDYSIFIYPLIVNCLDGKHP